MHKIRTFFFTCLLFFVAGWLPSTLDVRYTNHLFNMNFIFLSDVLMGAAERAADFADAYCR